MWARDGGPPEGPLIVAHGAGAALASGNVLAGLRRAIALGAHMIEFDVRRMADGTLVVHHDAAVDGVPLASADHRRLAANTGLVTLEELLDAVAGRVALDVELKEPGYEEQVLSLVLAHTPRERVVVTSFSAEALRAVKRCDPTLTTGLLVGRRPSARAPWTLIGDAFPFRRLAGCGADFLAPSLLLVRAGGMGWRAASRGVRVLVWTVNTPRGAARLLRDPNVLGVVTDSADVVATSAPRPLSFGEGSP